MENDFEVSSGNFCKKEVPGYCPKNIALKEEYK